MNVYNGQQASLLFDLSMISGSCHFSHSGPEVYFVMEVCPVLCGMCCFHRWPTRCLFYPQMWQSKISLDTAKCFLVDKSCGLGTIALQGYYNLPRLFTIPTLKQKFGTKSSSQYFFHKMCRCMTDWWRTVSEHTSNICMLLSHERSIKLEWCINFYNFYNIFIMY